LLPQRWEAEPRVRAPAPWVHVADASEDQAEFFVGYEAVIRPRGVAVDTRAVAAIAFGHARLSPIGRAGSRHKKSLSRRNGCARSSGLIALPKRCTCFGPPLVPVGGRLASPIRATASPRWFARVIRKRECD